jgi:UrcA family protein
MFLEEIAMTRTFTAAAAAALATVATFAATSSARAETTTVQIGDLDLSTAEGQAKLESRIDRAARRVCKDAVTGSRVAAIDAECVKNAKASIEKQLTARSATSRNGG